MSESEEKMEEIITVLQDQVIEDSSVPKNIVRAAKESIQALKNENKEPSVRASDAVEILDDVSNDPNIPMHTRTIIWEVLGNLETIE